MGFLRIFFVLLTLVMAASIVFGFLQGDFFEEGGDIIGLVWGKVTLIDLYIQFITIWLFVVYKEGNPAASILWLLLFLTLGSLATSLYITITLFQSDTLYEFFKKKKSAF